MREMVSPKESQEENCVFENKIEKQNSDQMQSSVENQSASICSSMPHHLTEVMPFLYLGASTTIPSTLDRLNIDCVISCAPELPDPPLSNSKQMYFKVNILDRSDADIKTFFHEVADLIEQIRKTNGKTVIYCVAGVSRSASFCIAYLIKHMDMTLSDAFKHVKSVRTQIRPNIGFFRQLIAFEAETRGEQTVSMICCKALGQEIPDVYEPEYRAMEEFYEKQQKRFKKR